jgi:hypothetical protein
MYVLKIAAFLVCFLLLLVIVLIIAFAMWFAVQTRPRRRREPGFEYVWVDDYGNARELDADQRAYLSTEFHGADGARPYIKFRYESLTPDGRLIGYLRRRQLPKGIPVGPGPDGEQ